MRLGRLLQQAAFPLSEPARIQDWAGYRDARPIGLNPAQTYNFIMEPPTAEGRVWLTSLPPGACITAIRHAPQQSVIELGAAQDSAAAEVEVLFHRDCLAVRDAARDHAGPFRAGTVAKFTTHLPGGLVFVWEEPKPVDSRFTSNFLGSSGHLHANGVSYDWWTYNSAIRGTTFAINKQDAPAPILELGTGLHRAWCDQWVDLAAHAQPVLRFDLGYPASEDPKQRAPRPLLWSVRVNGTEVWRERVPPGGDWLPREVPLADYAGRTVLVTLSAEEESDADVSPTHLLTPARFGNVRLVNNPRSEAKPDGSTLPRPAKVLLEDRFEGRREIPLQPAELPVYHERFYGWLRVTLTADRILFWLSTDGKSWAPQAEFPRTAACASSPQQLLLGRGTGGAGDLFQNDERWPTGVTTCQLADLVVGRDQP